MAVVLVLVAINTHMLMAMTTEQQYRDKAKEARDKAESATATRQTWLEIAKGFERLAEVPGKTPWQVERVERKK